MTQNRFKQAREWAGLSLTQTKKLLGEVKTSNLSQLEDGSCTPTQEDYEALSVLYRVNIPWLKNETVEGLENVPALDLISKLDPKDALLLIEQLQAYAKG